MLLSSRANPPKALGAFPSRNLTVRQLLLSSPLPSPALPALIPRHGKKPPPLNTRRALRWLCWLAICITLYYVASGLLKVFTTPSWTDVATVPYLASSGKTYQIVEEHEMPDYPTPIAVTEHNGRHGWTVSIPEKLAFPLAAADYADICSHVDEVARHASSGKHGHSTHHGHIRSYTNYIDVDDAQLAGLLPQKHRHNDQQQTLPVCKRSLTYVLDATDAGLGSTLLGLWLSYSVAIAEDRAFFIDDTFFAYGSYSTYFHPLPTPLCAAPPKSQRVPCPRQAKHLVISAATHQWSFGGFFHQQHTTHEIYAMARQGYLALFKLRSDDLDYATARLQALKHNETSPDKSSDLIGIHLRRGDRHPFEFSYQHSYLPVHAYSAAAQSLASQSSSKSVVLATDDPDIYTHSDLSSCTRAQDRIHLAAGRSLNGGVGWEGGFFKDLFWGLGLPLEAEERKRVGSPLPSRKKVLYQQKPAQGTLRGDKEVRDYRTHPTDESRQLREYIGRAYLLDLAVLGGSDGVVCAVSSVACRILAVMLGWDKAMEEGKWVNVDVGQWKALDWEES